MLALREVLEFLWNIFRRLCNHLIINMLNYFLMKFERLKKSQRGLKIKGVGRPLSA